MLIRRREFLKGMGAVGAVGAVGVLAGPSSVQAAVIPTEGARIYAWYHRNFYHISGALSGVEKEYADTVFRLEGNTWSFDVNNDYVYSMITFSHRVKGNKVNSSRLALASIKHARRLQPLMAKMIAGRGVDPQILPDFDKTAGMGWDIEEDHLKAYFFLPDVSKVKDPEVAALRNSVKEPHHPTGYSAVTIKDGKVFEKKLYLAMTSRTPSKVSHLPFTGAIDHTNYMVTTRRGIVPQVDIKQAHTVSGLNATGQQIVSKYREIGETVDTVNYTSKDDFTLYFP